MKKGINKEDKEGNNDIIVRRESTLANITSTKVASLSRWATRYKRIKVSSLEEVGQK